MLSPIITSLTKKKKILSSLDGSDTMAFLQLHAGERNLCYRKKKERKKEIYDSIVFPFEYGELITCICFFIIILRFKLCHRQKETWKWWDWQGSMNSLIWISFINSSSHTGKELACFAKSELE